MGNIIICSWVYPKIINIFMPEGDKTYPFKNIIPAFLFPEFNIYFGGTCRKGISKSNAAIAALFTFEIFWWHIHPPEKNMGSDYPDV